MGPNLPERAEGTLLSAEHKRPLYAFVVVAILCGIVVGHTLRTDAVSGLLGPLPSAVASRLLPAVGADPAGHGLVLAAPADPLGVKSAGQTDGSTAPVLVEDRSRRTAPPTQGRTGRHGTGAKPDRAATDVAAEAATSGPDTPQAAPGQFAGHDKGKAQGKAVGHHKPHLRAADRGHRPAARAHGLAKGHTKARGNGHAKARGNGHAKSRGKEQARGHQRPGRGGHRR